jgi:hypothetical protein
MADEEPEVEDVLAGCIRDAEKIVQEVRPNTGYVVAFDRVLCVLIEDRTGYRPAS